MTSELLIRSGGPDDFDTLVGFRFAMFREMGWTDEDRLARLGPAYTDFLQRHLDSGSVRIWIAEQDGETAGAVALLSEEVPPTVRNITGQRGYVFGLYVRPEWRKRGIGNKLAHTAVDFARSDGAQVVALHSSDHGRTIYEQMGFIDSPEMRLFTDPASAAWSAELAQQAEPDD